MPRCIALAAAAALSDGPAPFGDLVGAGIIATGVVLAASEAIGEIATSRTDAASRGRPSPAVFHRLESPTQTPSDAAAQQSSGQLWGKGFRDSGVPYVQAFTGPLPAGARGIEFTTPVPQSKYSRPGFAAWTPGTPGVVIEGDVAKIPITVTKNTQKE